MYIVFLDLQERRKSLELDQQRIERDLANQRRKLKSYEEKIQRLVAEKASDQEKINSYNKKMEACHQEILFLETQCSSISRQIRKCRMSISELQMINEKAPSGDGMIYIVCIFFRCCAFALLRCNKIHRHKIYCSAQQLYADTHSLTSLSLY